MNYNALDYNILGKSLLESIKRKGLLEHLKRAGILLKACPVLPLDEIERGLFELLKDIDLKIEKYKRAVIGCEEVLKIHPEKVPEIDKYLYGGLKTSYQEKMNELSDIYTKLTDIAYNFQAHQSVADLNEMPNEPESELKHKLLVFTMQLDSIKDNKNGINFVGTEDSKIPQDVSDIRKTLRVLWGQISAIPDIQDKLAKYTGKHHALILKIDYILNNNQQ